jgi:5-oxoprolinase (ATP-hydrolysing) subunit A
MIVDNAAIIGTFSGANQGRATMKINLNADIGESFGKFRVGDDAELMKIISSANIACGMHAGDPTIMHETTLLAKSNGVSIGAHPGYNDLWGFGRRPITMRMSDLRHLVAYQIGALQAIAAVNGLAVTHVKPHGQLHNMAIVDFEIADAIAAAVKSVDPQLIFVGLAGSQLERAAKKREIRFAMEGFADRRYEDDGNLTSRVREDAVIKDPGEAARQVVRMVTAGEVVARSGKVVPLTVHSLCVHGDEPTAVNLAREVRAALEKAGVAIVPLTQMGI